VKLPNLKNYADLVFSDDDDERPNNDIHTSGNNNFVEQNRFSLALHCHSSPKTAFSHCIVMTVWDPSILGVIDYNAADYSLFRWNNHFYFPDQTNDWLFYEFVTFILWRRDERFPTYYGITLRVEGFLVSRKICF
jgi:hypothetical protein